MGPATFPCLLPAHPTAPRRSAAAAAPAAGRPHLGTWRAAQQLYVPPSHPAVTTLERFPGASCERILPCAMMLQAMCSNSSVASICTLKHLSRRVTAGHTQACLQVVAVHGHKVRAKSGCNRDRSAAAPAAGRPVQQHRRPHAQAASLLHPPPPPITFPRMHAAHCVIHETGECDQHHCDDYQVLSSCMVSEAACC
jgi:hypothetical protein